MALWTEADRDQLKAAIAGGAVLQSLTFADQTYTFRSLEDMLKLLAVMEADLNAASGATKAYRLAATSKGV